VGRVELGCGFDIMVLDCAFLFKAFESNQSFIVPTRRFEPKIQMAKPQKILCRMVFEQLCWSGFMDSGFVLQSLARVGCPRVTWQKFDIHILYHINDIRNQIS
jgi:hypothetical protein